MEIVMKKIFFVTLLSLGITQLQAFFELYNDTNYNVHVETQFDGCQSQIAELKPKQQGVKIKHTLLHCANNKIYFVTTDEIGAQRRATLYFDSKSGPVFDPGITFFKNSASADYWFSIKDVERGEYAITVPMPCGKDVNAKLAEVGYKKSAPQKTVLGYFYTLSKSGRFNFTEYRNSANEKFRPLPVN
jgi:hypothetical protein